MARETGPWRRRAAMLYRQALTDPCPATRATALLAAGDCLTQDILLELEAEAPRRSAQIIPFVPRAA